jgi:hypothetical protein
MKKIFWILVLGAIGSAAVAVGLGQAAHGETRPTRYN